MLTNLKPVKLAQPTAKALIIPMWFTWFTPTGFPTETLQLTKLADILIRLTAMNLTPVTAAIFRVF